MLWMPSWGSRHDCHNAIKQGTKKGPRSRGVINRAIVRFSALANFKHGPFRSGAWGVKLRERHTRLVEEHSADSGQFWEHAKRQSQLQPERYASGGAFDFHKAWADFGCIPSCCGGDGAWATVKFARWGSVGDAWLCMRKELFFLRDGVGRYGRR